MFERTASHDLIALFQELLRRARQNKQPQKLGLTTGVLLRVAVEGKLVKVLIVRPLAEITRSDLVTVRSQCGIPPHARRVPEQEQYRKEIRGKLYFSVEYIWSP